MSWAPRIRLLVPALLGALLWAGAASTPPAAAATCTAHLPIIRDSIAPCSVVELENIAYEVYAATHDLPIGDPRIEEAGAQEIAGILYGLFKQIAFNIEAGHPPSDPDLMSAYEWLQGVVKAYDVNAAQYAIDEFNEWKFNPCAYDPPDLDTFTFRGIYDSACSKTTASLLRGPSPPTLAEFIDYGLYRQAENAKLQSPASSLWVQVLQRDSIVRYSGAWAMLAGPGASFLTGLVPGLQPKIEQLIRPHLKAQNALDAQRSQVAENKLSQGSQQKIAKELKLVSDADLDHNVSSKQGVDLLRKTGVSLSDDAAKLAERGALNQIKNGGFRSVTQAIIRGGLNATKTIGNAARGVISAGGAGFFVAGIAISIAQSEAEEVIRAEQLPGQLNQHLQEKQSDPNLAAMFVDDGGGAAYLLQILASTFDPDTFDAGIGKLSTSNPAGLTNPPYRGDQIQVAYANPGGDTAYVERTPIVPLRSWPVGVEMGSRGVGFSRFALNNGILYRTPTPDEQKAGGSGWYPTGALEYYGWAAKPRIAFVKGDQFVDMPALGSGSMGGWDSSEVCENTVDCRVTPVLFALGPGDQKLRVSLKPNTGTPAIIGIDNLLGGTAGTDLSGIHSGLVAGQTVKLINGAVSPNGLETTYTWTVETRCAHGDTCTPSSDPAFHGNPVTMLTGQTARFTWPSSGTFHVRMTTTDEFGVTKVADRDVTVVGEDPRLELVTSPPLTNQAFGPIKQDDLATFTGCILSESAAYTVPSVTIDWGDGTEESRTGEGIDGGLEVAFDATPSGGCSSPWSFTADHDYDVTATMQRPVEITIADGLGQSRVIDLGANLVHLAAPTFTSADAATFNAGTTGSFKARTTGAPTPALSLLGSLPTGVGFATHGDGTLTLNGSAHIDSGGTYPLTVRAVNSEATVDQAFTLTVRSAPRFTSAATLTVAEGDAVDFPITTAGFPAPNVLLVGDLPDGLDYTGGEIVGTPDAGSAGVYNVEISASSFAGSAWQNLRLVVGNDPSVTSPDTAPFIEDGPQRTFTITTSGFPAPDIDLAGTLPTGLFFADNNDGTAVIFGSASEQGSASVDIDVENDAGTDHQDLTINVSATGGPSVTVDSDPFDEPRFQVGNARSYDVISSDPAATLSATGNLPSGVTFTPGANGTATIAGTPAADTSGQYSLVITAEKAGSPDGLAFALVQVFGPPVFTSAGTAPFAVGSPGSFAVTTSAVPRAVINKEGALPDGLSFEDQGLGTAVISGTPAAGSAGQHTIQLEAVNLMNLGNPTEASLVIEVAQAPTVTSSGAVHLATGVAGSFDVTTTGYPEADLTVTGLPLGLIFTDDGDGTGTVTGTPSDLTVTTYPVVVEASSTAGTTSQAMTLTVAPKVAFTSADSAAFTRDQAGTFTITTTGSPVGTPATTIAADDPLPDGLSLVDNGDGTATLSGTPIGTAQASVVTISATNGFGETEQELTIGVGAAPALIGGTNREVRSGPRGGGNAWTLTTSGFPSPALSLDGALPNGLTFIDNDDGTATIEGQPSNGTEGEYPLVLHMENAHGSADANLTIKVTATAIFTSPQEVTFVAGVPQTYTATTNGVPVAAEITGGSLPSWLHFSQSAEQKAKGEATLTGTAPASALGSDFRVSLLSNNNVPNGDLLMLNVVVAPVGFTAFDPPEAALGETFSYSLGAEVGGGGAVTFSLADGSVLPPGMTLDPNGTLSGQPQAVGTWVIDIVATTALGSATTSITMTVEPTPGALLISEFRLYGPDGTSDWYAKVTNTTGQPLVLDGWELGLPLRAGETGTTGLGDGTLEPGASRLVTGPFFSRSVLGAPSAVGPPAAAFPGGLQILAPDGTVVDAAGQDGSPSGYFLGTPLPREPLLAEQGAYVRRTSGCALVDTNDTAADFTYVSDPSAVVPDDPTPGADPTPTPTPTPTRVRRRVGRAKGSITVGDGKKRIVVRWRKNTFRRSAKLEVRHVSKRGVARGTTAVAVAATRSGKPLKTFRRPLRVVFATTRGGVRPAYRARGKWVRISRVKGDELPRAKNYGWYRDRARRYVVIIRHPAVVGLVPRAAPAMSLRVTGGRVVIHPRLTA